MPGFTPGRRYQPPFMPFKRQPFKKRAFAAIELAVKGPLARDRADLPNGMPKGFTQWTLRRFNS